MVDQLRVLLLGSGGREHALAWALSRSNLVEKVLCVPGNGGTAIGDPKIENGPPGIATNDFALLVSLAREQRINLVVPGSEEAIVRGVEDRFRQEGIPVFGPSKGAARLEGSKCFAKDFMARHSIPTAKYWNCSTVEDAYSCLDRICFPVVIKASGLAGGKGVLMPSSREEARAAVESMMVQKTFGDAGAEIVIEELLSGDEISITFVSDGTSLRLFPVGQDAQRILDGNIGANTGGMGVYAPTHLLSPEGIDDIVKIIFEPTIKGIRDEGIAFTKTTH
jgi:phosphoribosylamine--glycine ligase / phosphoribosylformylglycinamidine cyclo-ligase